jgi:hypothetical protein
VQILLCFCPEMLCSSCPFAPPNHGWQWLSLAQVTAHTLISLCLERKKVFLTITNCGRHIISSLSLLLQLGTQNKSTFKSR